VDEGQDFQEYWWLAIERLLRRPKDDGLWVFFDPKQNIYGGSAWDALGLHTAPLTFNCRNTQRIARHAYALVAAEPKLRVGTPEGVEVIVERCKTRQEMLDAVRRALHQAWDDDDLDEDDEFDDPGADAYGWNERSPLRAEDIHLVVYGRGEAATEDDAYAGRNLDYWAWSAPDIPADLFETLQREWGDDLDNTWRPATLTTPVLVETMELHASDSVVTCEVLDRAAIVRELAAGVINDVQPEDAGRLEALCAALARAAADSGRPITQEELERLRRESAALVEEEEVAEPPARVAPNVDLAALDEAHGTQGGACQLCGAKLARDEAVAHLDACAPAHDIKKGKAQALVSLRITAAHSPAYWLELEMRDEAPLAALDRLLRRRWVECCEHRSQFRIGRARYSSDGGAFSMLGTWRRDMDVRLRDVLPRLPRASCTCTTSAHRRS
jgi:hypothetical protein